jgi:hypothetical protein
VPVVVEPPNAQAIYAVLDSAMSAVLTNKNVNIQDQLKTANGKIQTILQTQTS